MKEKTAHELSQLAEDFCRKHSGLDDKTASVKISEDKWTLKEIVGHLIYSASNNHQRIIRLQLCSDLDFPDYNKDEWLNTADYNSMNFHDLLSLHKYFNLLIAKLMLNVKKESLSNRWNFSFTEKKDHITLEELIDHYLSHFKIHMKHFEERLSEVKDIMQFE